MSGALPGTFAIFTFLAVGANIRQANREIAVRSFEQCCTYGLTSHFLRLKAEASQNNGKSDFQAAYASELTANEMGDAMRFATPNNFTRQRSVIRVFS